jgi:hypothetical protein
MRNTDANFPWETNRKKNAISTPMRYPKLPPSTTLPAALHAQFYIATTPCSVQQRSFQKDALLSKDALNKPSS